MSRSKHLKEGPIGHGSLSLTSQVRILILILILYSDSNAFWGGRIDGGDQGFGLIFYLYCLFEPIKSFVLSVSWLCNIQSEVYRHLRLSMLTPQYKINYVHLNNINLSTSL